MFSKSCKWCTKPLKLSDVDVCSECFKLEQFIKTNPKLVVKMIEYYYNPKKRLILIPYIYYIIAVILVSILYLNIIKEILV